MLQKLTDKLFLSKQGWLCIKITLVWCWLPEMISLLPDCVGLPLPNGLCELLNCQLFLSPDTKIVMICLLVIASIAYLFEVFMPVALLVIAILSFVIISLHESNGIMRRASLFTMVWVGQLVAYVIYRKDDSLLRFYRHQYPVQFIAATYTLAAISKLYDSGLHWPADGAQFMAIHSFKGYAYSYFDTLNRTEWQKGLNVVHLMLAHKQLIYFFLTGAVGVLFFVFF
jgi:hypothetical protein